MRKKKLQEIRYIIFFLIGDEFIRIKKEQFFADFGKESDIEKATNEKIEFEDKEVFKVTKENIRIMYIWYENDEVYIVTSSIEEKETLKFIENIKILKNF